MSKNEEIVVRKTNPYLGFVLGAIASCCGETVSFPADTAKIRLQLDKGKHFSNLRQTVHGIIVKEGIPALYQGITAAWLRQIFYGGLRFALYDAFTGIADKYITPVGENIASGHKFISAGLAGFVAAGLVNPTDVIKIRMQACTDKGNPRYKSTRDAIKQIWARGGLKGLYRGSGATATRSAIVAMSDIFAYDAIKTYLVGKYNWEPSSLYTQARCAVLAGLITTTASSPVDVIKTRYINQEFVGGRGVTYQSLLDCIVKTIRSDGFYGLFKGWVPTYCRIGPHVTVTFVIYDQLRTFMLGEAIGEIY
mmetsp:Transcript_2312/g.3348  ORF Transcript_2312/g.3348 Transcript_2312/m.3348 type:complete len:308 (+) Transcript_2312:289-1212(+)